MVAHAVEDEVDDPRDAIEQARIQGLEPGVGRTAAQRMDDGREQVHDGAALVVGEVEPSGRLQAIEDLGAAVSRLLQGNFNHRARCRDQ